MYGSYKKGYWKDINNYFDIFYYSDGSRELKLVIDRHIVKIPLRIEGGIEICEEDKLISFLIHAFNPSPPIKDTLLKKFLTKIKGYILKNIIY
jgi:hypothetical protein